MMKHVVQIQASSQRGGEMPQSVPNTHATRNRDPCCLLICMLCIWGFPKIRGTFLGGPHNKDYSISGSILGSLFRDTTIYKPKTVQTPNKEQDNA